MIIGNKETFATEFTLCDNYTSLLEGTFSYWINSKKVGNDSELVYLNDVLMCMIWIIHDIGNRIYSEKITNDWNEIFHEINKNIYESDTFYSCPARYDISINIPTGIGHYKVFYIEDSQYGYLMFKRKSDNIVNEFTIKKGVVDLVLSQTHSELNKLYESIH